MILELVAGIAVVAAAVAIKKHGSVSAALASAKKEVAILEGKVNLASIEASAKAELLDLIAKIKAL